MVCDTPFFVFPAKWSTEKIPVPCGRCPPCKLRRVNSWVFRLMEQEKVSTTAHFVTLTYDTRYVPISPNGFMTLSKRDIQNWVKRLRKLEPESIKYYLVGEYGTKNKRPHYHAIVFGVQNPQLFVDAWTLVGNQLGGVHIGSVTSDSIAYTMKYIDKQSFRAQHARDDRQPEFPLMSKGLGENYLTEEVKRYHRANVKQMYVSKRDGHKIALPRYYREKLFDESDKRDQVAHIRTVFEQKEQEQRRNYIRLYGGTADYGYEQYVEDKKFGRYKIFYQNQKNRDLL